MAFRPLGTAAKKPPLLASSTSSSRCNSVSRTAAPANISVKALPSAPVSSYAPRGVSTAANASTLASSQRIPVHLRGAKPPAPTPPHPLEADIAAETSAIDALEQTLIAKYAASYQLYDTIVSSLEEHRVQLRSDKRQREAETECNQSKIAKAEARLQGLQERLQLEESQCETMRQRVADAQAVHRGIVDQVTAMRKAASERVDATEQLRHGSQSVQAQIQTMEAEIVVSKRKKEEHMNNLDGIRETVARDQADEQAAVAELHQRKEHIKGIHAKIEKLRCLKRRGGGGGGVRGVVDKGGSK